MYENDKNMSGLPDMAELRVDSEDGKRALIDHTFGRMFSGVNFSLPLLLMPLEVNGIFLSNGIYVFNAFTFSEGLTNFNAITNLERTYENLKELIRSEFSHHCINYVVEIGGIVFDICCYFISDMVDLEAASGPERLCRLSCDKINQQWKELHGDSLVIVSSEPFVGVNNMFAQYQKLLKQIEFQQYQYSGIRKVLPETNALDAIDKKLTILDNAIDAADEKQALQLIREIINDITQMVPKTISDYDFRVHYFLFRYEGILGAKQMLTESMKHVLRSNCFPDSADQLYLQLQDITHSAIKLANDSKASTMGRMLLRIETYVHENIADKELSATAIADYLHISASSLSNRFKRAKGQKLIDYIAEERIAYAESLIKTTKLSIEEVSDKAGYGSVSTMYRAFHKYRGISPNALRSTAS